MEFFVQLINPVLIKIKDLIQSYILTISTCCVHNLMNTTMFGCLVAYLNTIFTRPL